jgi:ribosomal protein L7/L12
LLLFSFFSFFLDQAKDLVEKAPVVLMKDVPKAEIDAIMKKLEEVGAKLIKS